MGDRIKLGISSCLLGEKVRYDGGHQRDRFLTDTLGQYIEWIPVCPEVECGLPIPREAMRLVGSPESYRLVTNKTGVDHTARMLNWAAGKLKELEKEDLCGFVFKNRSPSSGMQGVKVYNAEGIPASKGPGIFAGALMKHLPLLPVEDDGRLNDARLREVGQSNITDEAAEQTGQTRGGSGGGKGTGQGEHGAAKHVPDPVPEQ